MNTKKYLNDKKCGNCGRRSWIYAYKLVDKKHKLIIVFTCSYCMTLAVKWCEFSNYECLKFLNKEMKEKRKLKGGIK